MTSQTNYATDHKGFWFIEDESAGLYCACGQLLVIDVSCFETCDGCGRRYKLELITRVIEAEGD